MDLLEQFAAVWARRFTVLLIALEIAIGVFLLRSVSPERFEATSVVQIRLNDAASGDPTSQVDYYVDTVIGLATSRTVVAEAVSQAEVATDPEEVADAMNVEAGTEPGFVHVTVTGDTGPQVARLADALVAAVAQRVAADQDQVRIAERDRLSQALAETLDQLQNLPSTDNATQAALVREREELLSALRSNAVGGDSWQVVTVDGAQTPDSPVSPIPWRDAVLAFLLGLILVAETIVIRRAWRGAISARDPVRDVSEALGDVPTVRLDALASPGAVAPVLPHVGSTSRVTVVHLGSRPGARTAVLLAELLALRGSEVLLVDASTSRPSVHRELPVPLTPGLTELTSEPATGSANGSAGVSSGGATREPAEASSTAHRLLDVPRVGRTRVLTAGRRPDRANTSSPSSRLARVVAASSAERFVFAASCARPEELVDILGERSGPVVVDVDADVTKPELREAAATWRGLGVDLVAATVTTRPSSPLDRVRRWRRRHAAGGAARR